MEIKITGLDELITDINKFAKVNNRALSSAMNRVATTAQKEAVIEVRKTWVILARDMKKAITQKKATVANPTHTLIINSKSIPLIKFMTRQGYLESTTATGRKRKGGAGVRYKLSRKARGSKALSKSFIRKSKYNGGRLEIFTRRPSPQGANITAQYAITPTSMFNQKATDKYIKTFIEAFEKRYKHQLDYFMKL